MKSNDFYWTLLLATDLVNKPVRKWDNFMKKSLTNTEDPFLPPLIDELVIEYDFTEKHRLILNKYPINRRHVLIITKEFEHQTTALDYYDIEAWLMVMRAQDPGIVYFNSGKDAGASQPHKHMQSLPEANFTTTMGILPLSLAIQKYLKKNEVDTSVPFQFPKFDFKHEIRFFQFDLIDMIDSGNLKYATEYVYDIYKGKHTLFN